MSTLSREFRSYLTAIERFARLDRQAELELARRYRAGDAGAGHALAECHLRSVVGIARRYAGAGAPLSDLVAAGNLGLLEAVRRFEPERGLRFLTYARYWIRAYVLERLRRGQAGREASLDAPIGDLDGATRLDRLRAGGPSPEELAISRQERELLGRVLADLWAELDERERSLLERRLLAADGGESLRRVGLRFHLTRERLRQIEVELKEKLRQALVARSPARAGNSA